MTKPSIIKTIKKSYLLSFQSSCVTMVLTKRKSIRYSHHRKEHGVKSQCKDALGYIRALGEPIKGLA